MINEINKIIASGKMSGTAEVVKLYEEALKTNFKVKYAVATSSGTGAIHASLLACNIGYNDEVIVPVYATLPTVMPILALGAVPKFVNIESNLSLNICIDHLSSLVGSKTKAMIALPLWGYPLNYEELLSFCRKNGLHFIEDACQSHCSQYGDKYLGTLGDIGCFSTHDKKLLSTGEGGFILTNNKTIYKSLISNIKLGGLNGQDFGLNYKLSAISASIGLASIPTMLTEVAKRRSMARQITQHISGTQLSELVFDGMSLPNYYNFVFTIKPKHRLSEKNLKKIHNYIIKNHLISEWITYGGLKYNKKLLRKFSKSNLNGGDLFRYSFQYDFRKSVNLDTLFTILNKVDKMI